MAFDNNFLKKHEMETHKEEFYNLFFKEQPIFKAIKGRK
jgi:hypothetical protein